eukprot:158986_1
MASKSRVCYYYDSDVGSYYYGGGHPMKPHRIRLTHNLLLNYGLYRKMEVYRPHCATDEEIQQFHSEEYVSFLKKVTPENWKEYVHQLQKFNLGEFTDCPVFDGVYKFCQSYVGGSIDGAMKLNHGMADIAVNWSGGLHHAKKSEASGFCYVNDIVLGILELLKFHSRVLYIDIDIHHGDGVEEAFYTTDRVMTCSFHKFGDFFPGTGDHIDVGAKEGKYYSVNFPLESGIDDDGFQRIFKPVISKIMELYRPGAIVLQCGADSLTGDRLGCFNVTLKGHGECVTFVKSLGVPVLVLGGGGYNKSNVARCWAYETSVILESDVGNNIPYNDYFEYYGPDFKLHLQPSDDLPNLNTKSSLENMMQIVLQNIGMLECAPSVPIQDVPRDNRNLGPKDEESKDPDVRETGNDKDRKIEHESELFANDE